MWLKVLDERFQAAKGCFSDELDIMSKATTVLCRLVFFLAGVSMLWCNANAQTTTPLTDNKIHEGVASCSGSTCHSRQEATGIIVRQNEILTWQDDTSVAGAHYRAYKTLESERSAAIAKRLGLTTPATESPECLSCHADNVSEELRGEKFQIDDGVGCESCHGAAGDWLSTHYKEGADHAANIEAGLYALEDPSIRAGVCLSCHMGSDADGQFVNHRLMASGHPRMSFELDLFTALQSHHDEDFDYERRKSIRPGAQVWATGQVAALRQQLRLFENPMLNRDGVFPEPVFFECRACHRPISDDPDWQPQALKNPGRPNIPGAIRFNDASMIMSLAIARQIAPEMADDLDQDIKNFHRSISDNKNGALASAALISACDTLIEKISSTEFTKAQTLKILDEVMAETLSRRYTDYVAGEQAIMAVDTLFSSMIAAKQISRLDVNALREEIEQGYSAVEEPNIYSPAELTEALRLIQARLQEHM